MMHGTTNIKFTKKKLTTDYVRGIRVIVLFTFILYISLLLFRIQKSEYNKIGNVHIYVTSRRIRVTVAAVEKQYVFHILSVCLGL